MNRQFTLEEAQRLLPEVERCLRQALAARESYQAAESGLEDVAQRMASMGGLSVNPVEMLRMKRERESGALMLKKSIESIHEMGVQVKDLDLGLVDFPTMYRGAEVLLCWKLGESGISFWHGIEEGFRGRKRIDRDFLDHHEGSGAQ